jgi:indole-3-glycerol phosphate synthase
MRPPRAPGTFDGFDGSRAHPVGRGDGPVSAISEEVLARVRADLIVRQTRVPLGEVKRRALARPSALDGAGVLRGEGVAVIADVNPSHPDKPALAGDYERGGARVVGIAAGTRYAAGALGDLTDIRVRVQVPVLCTELIVSSYPLWEARAHGADLVLLTVAALEQEELVSLVERAASIGLGAMVEVRDGRELVRAVGAGAGIIAVAPRDPDTRDVDRAALAHLLPLIPEGIVRVAECGSAGRSDLIACARAGADALRVGAPLLAGGNPRESVAALVAVGAHPALARGRRQAV